MELINSSNYWRIVNTFGTGVFKIKDQTNGADRIFLDPSGNIGIGVSSPNTSLDLAGSFSRRINTLDIGDVDSTHNLYKDSLNSVVRLIGPISGASTITGIEQGADGQIITFINLATQNLVFAHENASSAAVNRFLLPGNAPVVLSQYESISLVYSVSENRWLSKN